MSVMNYAGGGGGVGGRVRWGAAVLVTLHGTNRDLR